MSDSFPPLDPDHLQRFFELSPELLAVAATDGYFKFLNPAWEATLGWTTSELLAEPFISFVHPDDAADTLAEVTSLAAGHPAVSFLNRYRCKDGSFRHLRWTAAADASGAIYAAARDVSSYREVLEESSQNEELWRAVLRTAADPVVFIDETGTILQTNGAASELFGHAAEAMLGQNVRMLMPEPYHSEHDGYLSNYMKTGDAKIIGIGREVQAVKSDGTVFPMHLAVSEVVSSRGRMFTGIIHDLTERRASEDRLREANELLEHRVAERTAELESSMAELARSNRDLEQFAYIASHDLQAPLRNVRQGLELLDEHLDETIGVRFDEEAEELRGLVLAAIGRMEELIRGLLSYSRVQRQAQPVTETVDLGRVTTEVLAHLQIDLDAAGATVAVETLPIVQGDAAQLRQLMQNLIENAVKYRLPDRPSEIHIAASEDADHWVINVADNGLGVDEDQHERIFELFRRGHPGHDGVGIGLAICQRIVERHGGDIWVESRPDEGATFTFTLPTTEVIDAG